MSNKTNPYSITQPIYIKKWYKRSEYAIGAGQLLNEQQLNSIVGFLNTPIQITNSKLSGRTTVLDGYIDGIGEVVVKKYSRGGWLKYFIAQHYFRFGTLRPFQELYMLNKAIALNINVPTPIALASKGTFLYQAWLITKKIKNEGTLAEVSLSNALSARIYTEKLVEQMCLLIKNKILHIDLHPGNVIISSESKEPYILDFDKASVFHGTQEKLRDLYLRRWRRAVIKHNLPEILSEIMCLGLRSIQDNRLLCESN